MIIVIANIYVKDGKTVEFLEAAKQCIDETVKEDGCLQYTLVADIF